MADILDEFPIKDFRPDCILMIEITWYVLDKLDKFKKLLSKMCTGCGFFHTLMTYAPGVQKHGVEYFTNLDEIKSYWSDIIDIMDWGQISNINYNGGYRTFLYGRIK